MFEIEKSRRTSSRLATAGSAVPEGSITDATAPPRTTNLKAAPKQKSANLKGPQPAAKRNPAQILEEREPEPEDGGLEGIEGGTAVATKAAKTTKAAEAKAAKSAEAKAAKSAEARAARAAKAADAKAAKAEAAAKAAVEAAETAKAEAKAAKAKATRAKSSNSKTVNVLSSPLTIHDSPITPVPKKTNKKKGKSGAFKIANFSTVFVY